MLTEKDVVDPKARAELVDFLMKLRQPMTPKTARTAVEQAADAFSVISCAAGHLHTLSCEVRDIVESVDQHGRCTLVLMPGNKLLEAFRAAVMLGDLIERNAAASGLVLPK